MISKKRKKDGGSKPTTTPSTTNKRTKKQKVFPGLSKGLEFSVPSAAPEKLKPTKTFPSLLGLSLNALHEFQSPPMLTARVHSIERLVETILAWDFKRRSAIPNLSRAITALFPYCTKLDLANQLVAFDELQRCSEMESLDLSHTQISDSQLIAFTLNNPKLHMLNLTGCTNLTPQGITRAVQCCKNLTALNISHLPIRAREFLLSLVESCTYLSELSVGYLAHFNALDLNIIPKFLNLTSLDLSGLQSIGHLESFLKLGSTSASGMNLKSLILASVSDLNDFHLYYVRFYSQLCKFSIAHSGAISKSALLGFVTACNVYIEDLDFAGQINCDDQVIFSLTKRCNCLSVLSVSYTLFSGLTFINAPTRFDHLTSLSIMGCVHLQKETVPKLRLACPALTHLGYDEESHVTFLEWTHQQHVKQQQRTLQLQQQQQAEMEERAERALKKQNAALHGHKGRDKYSDEEESGSSSVSDDEESLMELMNDKRVGINDDSNEEEDLLEDYDDEDF